MWSRFYPYIQQQLNFELLQPPLWNTQSSILLASEWGDLIRTLVCTAQHTTQANQSFLSVCLGSSLWCSSFLLHTFWSVRVPPSILFSLFFPGFSNFFQLERNRLRLCICVPLGVEGRQSDYYLWLCWMWFKNQNSSFSYKFEKLTFEFDLIFLFLFFSFLWQVMD